MTGGGGQNRIFIAMRIVKESHHHNIHMGNTLAAPELDIDFVLYNYKEEIHRPLRLAVNMTFFY